MSKKDAIYFETTDPSDRTVVLHESSWEHITDGHPEMTDPNEVKATIQNPNVITQQTDRGSLIYSKSGRSIPYVNVVAKMDDTYSKGVVKTAYVSTKLPKGKTIWMRKST